ncbi:MAG: hypothetical protein KF752_18115 [Pirellulaceae bacterium]|nr:hypothetical protein [Pirellulaceae bacterium]
MCSWLRVFKIRAVFCSVLGAGLVFLTGCAEPLIQVSGSVTVDGKPAEGAVLIFHPEVAEIPTVATAVTDANGKYQLVSDMNNGIRAGTYRVTATWRGPPKKTAQPTFGLGSDADLPDLLKGRYASKDTSGLTAVIEKSTVELPPLELTTKASRK